MSVKVAEEWLNICGGCECSLLDVGEPLLDILSKVEFVHMPVLMDHKYLGQTGEGMKVEVPEADVGLISGGIRTEEEREIAKEMRAKCKVIVAVGSCACFGGVPALANMFLKDEIFEKVYRETKSTVPGEYPCEEVPEWTDRVYALDEVIKVDVQVPGCPPPPSLIVEALTSILENKPFKLEEKAVCEDCPLKREKKAIASIKRPLDKYWPSKDGRCLLELGYLCLGPATRSGCRGDREAPRCIAGGFPCRGCFGPIRKGANLMVDMMGALATIGLNIRSIPDRLATFNRFLGAHNRLRPRRRV